MRGEAIFNTVLFGLSLFLYYIAGTFKKFAPYAKLGPDFWPKGILLALIVLSGFLCGKSMVRMIKSERAGTGVEIHPGEKENPYRLFLVIAASFAYAFGMSGIGFLISTFLFQIVLLYLLKVKRPFSLLLVSLVNTTMLYALFIVVLNMLLPTGVGIFRSISLFFY